MVKQVRTRNHRYGRKQTSRQTVSKVKSLIKRHKGKIALGAGITGLGYLGTRTVRPNGPKRYELVKPALIKTYNKVQSHTRRLLGLKKKKPPTLLEQMYQQTRSRVKKLLGY